MAICDDLKGVTVTVDAADGPLREYQDTDEEEELERTSTCYIEAKSDLEFKVTINVDKKTKLRGNALSFKIYVDGQRVSHPIASKARCKQGRTFSRDGIEISPGRMRKFKFAGLQTVADKRMVQGELEQVKDLGTIRVEVRHRNGSSTGTKKDHIRSLKETDFVSEKALKGKSVSHSVGFGEAIKKKSNNRWTSTDIPGIPNPAATFIFRYHSLDALKSMLIIPRTPTPPPLEERPIEELNMEELRELQRRARQAREERDSAIKVKREKRDDGELRRKNARPGRGDTQLELSEEGSFRESSTTSLSRKEKVVIELD